MKIEFIGHAGFVLSDEKTRVYIDPAISILGKEVKDHHPTAILLTHGHFDHVGDTLDLLRANPEAKVYAIVELANLLSIDLEGKPDTDRCVGCNKGGSIDIGNGWTATLVDAKHSSSYGPNRVYAGEAAGWVVRSADGTVVYHVGDTDSFAGMTDIVAIHKPAIALVCIGGHFTMGPAAAAYAVTTHLASTVRTVIPMHYGTWPILAGTPAELEKEIAAIAKGTAPVVKAMAPGTSWEF